jgi:putative ABC transport system permease protein
LAIRAALGAGRGRLVAQLLTESLVLCLVGGGAGVAVAFLLIRAATPFLAQSLPYTAAVGLDMRAFAFAAAVALGAALLVGALPAFGNLAQSLNRSARGSSGGHAGIRRTIVAAEVAISLVLVCGGLLLFRSLLKLQRLETGIQVENVITMSVNLPLATYPTPQRAALFYESVAERLNATPGIAQAAATTHLPLEWIGSGEGLWVAGVDEAVNVRLKRVDPGYFSTLGISLLAGRGITGRDRAGAPRVVVINQALAARLAEVAGIKEPVGRRVRISCPYYVEKGTLTADVEIAGVIRSERVAPPGRPDPPVAYVPLAQVPRPEVKLLVRTKLAPESAMPAVREALRQVDPNLPLGDIVTMRQVRERTLSGSSRPAWLIGAFAAVAALLAALGLYGVLAHAVTQQRREIGIRMALGASRGEVVSRVLRNALAMVVVGLALGAAGVFALTRLMRNLLFEVSPLDPAALSIACASMVMIGLLAGWLPARRAARVDPMTTLREEG